MTDIIYPNKIDFDDHFWDHDYEICIHPDFKFHINANDLQDAIDFLIDYLEENLPGLLFTLDEEKDEEYLDEYINGGNHSRYINTHYITFRRF